jgi:glycosyltransferase involved in cell wall biosynthesis
MRIAQVSPLYESVPPKYYGGTERVVSYLTEELVHQGHDVTLFASGDSITRARLVPGSPVSLRLDPTSIDQLAHHIVMLESVLKRAHEFDVIHFHVDYLHFPMSRRLETPQLTTLHGRLDLPDLLPVYREFPEMPVVSISNSQREPIPGAGWAGTVYHGLPANLYSFREAPGQYLAFLGRISPEKRVDRAIRIACELGIPLKIAAKVDAVDREYFKESIEPLLAEPGIEYIGEVGEREKDELLGHAMALLFPIDWPEPFGLVLIEALACGTPVVAYRRGSVPELLEDGVTGFLVDSLDDAVRAVERVPTLSRRRCRDAFDARFTASRMAADYVRLYQDVRKAATGLRTVA